MNGKFFKDKYMFITFEGIEGSGKTTQISSVASLLEDWGHDVLTTREPGATEIGKKIRSILLDPQNSAISNLSELLLYAADRSQHIEEVIIPAIEEGKTVLCDRYVDATTVYQGYARGIDLSLIKDIQSLVPGRTMPDITILFDLDPKVGLARACKDIKQGRRVDCESRFEKESIDFHNRVRLGYLEVANKEPGRFIVVDASLPKDEVFLYIKNKLRYNL